MAETHPPTQPFLPPSPRIAGLLLVALVGAAYFPALFCGFIWDDDVAIVDNENLRSISGLARIWTEPDKTPQGHYWPLVDVSFWLEYRLWGLNPSGYHLTNILLQMANALLVWRLLVRLQVPAAWFAAALFGVHPIQVESVAWIVERKNLLSGVFYFASIHAYLHHRETGSRVWMGWSLLLFVLGMLSKSSVLCLPFVLAILVGWKSPAPRLRDFAPLIPFFVLGGGIAVWDVSLVHRREVIDHGLSLFDRFTIAGQAFWFYLGKMAFPADLVAVYPRWETGAIGGIRLLWPLSVLFIGGVLLARAIRGRRDLLAVYLLYGVSLGPTLGFVDFGFMALSFAADRFSYLATVPVFALASAVGWNLIQKSGNETFWRGMAGIILCVLVLLSARQCLVYKDQERLVRHNLDRHPEAWIVRYNFAVDLAALGRTEEAISEYRRVLETNPEAHDARNNLGTLYVREGDLESAQREFERILESRPGDSRAHRNLGALHFRKGEREPALRHYRAALEAEPEDDELRGIVESLSRSAGSLE